ncbi:MAG: hypothetical protein ACI8Y7_001045 [Candidatus Woesearchaeota archaeon]|jgi:hypothetical protein
MSYILIEAQVPFHSHDPTELYKQIARNIVGITKSQKPTDNEIQIEKPDGTHHEGFRKIGEEYEIAINQAEGPNVAYMHIGVQMPETHRKALLKTFSDLKIKPNYVFETDTRGGFQHIFGRVYGYNKSLPSNQEQIQPYMNTLQDGIGEKGWSVIAAPANLRRELHRDVRIADQQTRIRRANNVDEVDLTVGKPVYVIPTPRTPFPADVADFSHHVAQDNLWPHFGDGEVNILRPQVRGIVLGNHELNLNCVKYRSLTSLIEAFPDITDYDEGGNEFVSL